MKTFRVAVTEVRHIPYVYTIAADTKEEAQALARIGHADKTEKAGKSSLVERFVDIATEVRNSP